MGAVLRVGVRGRVGGAAGVSGVGASGGGLACVGEGREGARTRKEKRKRKKKNAGHPEKGTRGKYLDSQKILQAQRCETETHCIKLANSPILLYSTHPLPGPCTPAPPTYVRAAARVLCSACESEMYACPMPGDARQGQNWLPAPPAPPPPPFIPLLSIPPPPPMLPREPPMRPDPEPPEPLEGEYVPAPP